MRSHRPPGLIALNAGAAMLILCAARGGGAIAILVFWVLALQRGLPRSVLQEQWEVLAQLAMLGLAALGYALTWKWEGIGAALMFTGSVALGVLASIEYRPTEALFGCLAFFAPAGLTVLHWQRSRRPRTFALVAAAMTVLLATGAVASSDVHDYYFGPTHPSSDRPAYPVDLVEWAWSGSVTTTGFTVKAKIAPNHAGVALLAGETVELASARETPGVVREGSRIAEFVVTGLTPNTTYHFAFREGSHDDAVRRGTVRTFPAGAASFTIAVGSCSSTGSNGLVYERLREANPLLFLATGDLHYEDITGDDPAAMRRAFDSNLAASAQQALYLTTPLAYTWDDHDFGGNGSNRESPARTAARAVYRDYVPHYPLPVGEGDAAIYQAFTIGRVRFLVTDTRSERDPASEPEGETKSMLGAEQKAWLKRELLAANSVFPVIVWVNSVPWIAANEPAGDTWGGFASERQEIADFMQANAIRGLAMISGDAHMLAIDDGLHNRFTTDSEGPGFPVFQAAALDRRGQVKGGPYSSRTFAGGGQFGLMTVTDDGGSEITVRWSGRNWRGEELVAYEFTLAAAFAR